jgi:hypothetical protein
VTARRHLDGPDRIGYWRDIIDDAAASITEAVRERDEGRAARALPALPPRTDGAPSEGCSGDVGA